MNPQEHKLSIPIFTFQYLSILILMYPIGILAILWHTGTNTHHSQFSILSLFAHSDSTFLLHFLSFFGMSFLIWNMRLNISESKIYYSVFNIPISWAIARNEISHSQFTRKYDPPYTYIKRKLKHLKTPESEQQFNIRYGTVELIFIQKSLLNSIRHKFSIIHLSSFSNKQAIQLREALQQYWDLKLNHET